MRWVRRSPRPHRAVPGSLRDSTQVDRRRAVRGRDSRYEFAARAGVDAAGDLLRLATARGAGRAGGRGRFRRPGSGRDHRARGSLSRLGSSDLGAGGGGGGRRRGCGGRAARRHRSHSIELAARPGDPPRTLGALRGGRTGRCGGGWPLARARPAWLRHPRAALAPARLRGGALPLGAVAGTRCGERWIGALAWVALKVGALSYGGGFVIVPLMQADAVDNYRWMTDPQFLNAVALGQVTPGPVVHTVAAVGYAAAGIWGALLAAVVAFAPSFSFILIGAERFDRLRSDPRRAPFSTAPGRRPSAPSSARRYRSRWRLRRAGSSLCWRSRLRPCCWQDRRRRDPAERGSRGHGCGPRRWPASRLTLLGSLARSLTDS